MKKLTDVINRLLKEYSPLALLIMVLLCFLPVDSQTHRRILLATCVFPGVILTLLNPRAVLKNPVVLMMLCFVAYFSAQQIRGMLPITTKLLRDCLVTSVLISFPVIALSFVTPERKLYPWIIGLTAVIASVFSSSALFSFYQTALFPIQRFSYDSTIPGLIAVMTSAFFLQKKQPGITRWLAWICLPFLLLPVFYTHARTAPLSIFFALLILLRGSSRRIRSTIVLLAMLASVFLIYQSSLYIAANEPSPEPPSQVNAKDGTTRGPQGVVPIRRGGFINAGSHGQRSATQRLYIWKDHLSRMNSVKAWVAGHGLGMRSFVNEVAYKQAEIEYVPTPNGFQLLAHSGYMWALYHGGLAGLCILAALLALAWRAAFRSGENGSVALALVVYSGIYMLFEVHRLLAGRGEDYVLLWLPVGLAAGLAFQHSFSSKEMKRHKQSSNR